MRRAVYYIPWTEKSVILRPDMVICGAILGMEETGDGCMVFKCGGKRIPNMENLDLPKT